MNELEQAISKIPYKGKLPLIGMSSSLDLKEEKIISYAPREELIDSVIKLKRYDLLLKVPNGFEKIIDKEEQIVVIKTIKTVPYEWKSRQELLEYFLNEKNYYIVLQFDLSDTLKENLKHEATNIIKNIGNTLPQEFKDNQYLLELCITEGKGELLHQFIPYVFSKKLIEKYIKILSSMENINVAECSALLYDENFFNICLTKKRYDVLGFFNEKFLTYEIIDKHGYLIALKLGSKVPFGLINNEKFFHKILQAQRYDLITQFKGPFITEEIISSHAKQILDTIYVTKKKRNRNIFSNELNIAQEFLNSKSLLKLVLEENKDNLIRYFSSELFDEEIISLYGSKILDIVIKNNLFYEFKFNSYLLEQCLLEKKYEIVKLFDKGCFNEKIINGYAKEISMSFNEWLPYELRDNKKLLKEYLESGKIEFCFHNFSEELFAEEMTEKFINKNKNLFINLFENRIPYVLRKNECLLDVYLEKGRFEVALSDFYSSAFTKKIIEKYKEKFINLFENKIPYVLRENEYLLDVYLEKGRIEVALREFESTLFKESTLKKYYFKLINWITKENNNTIPNILITNSIFKNLCYENNNIEMFLMFPFQENNKIINSDETISMYSKLLNISEEKLRNKINLLYSKNDEILKTLIPLMLIERMETLSFKNMLVLGLYPDLQQEIICLNNQELNVMQRILEYLGDSKYDNTAIIYNILKNFKCYGNIINNINVNNISEEKLYNLIFILQNKENFYSIQTIDDLTNNNFEQKVVEKYEQFNQRLNDNQVSIDEIKEMIFNKKFGMIKEQTDLIYNRYCFNKNIIINSKLDNNIKLLLIDIYDIYNCDNIEKLKYIYLTSERTITDFKTILFLESSIRNEYAKLYNNTLYTVKEEHLIENNGNLVDNIESLNKIKNISYNDKRPKVYMIDGDFNLLIHALGAYRDYQRPDNFLDDWNRPKMTNHGICTSYIGNNQIANARAYHPILGFAMIDEKELLLSGNYDLNSSNVNFSISMDMPSQFLPPKDMIDYTRHAHNEMVIERMHYENDTCNKKMPSYVVYLLDDVNNKYNFMTKEELIIEFRSRDIDEEIIKKISNEKETYFIGALLDLNKISTEDAHKISCVFYYEEIRQAATDMNLPIVLVDRLKYAKSELKKCSRMYDNFVNTLDYRYVDLLLTNYFNNMIGCIKYSEYDLEYYKYFNEEGFNNIYKNILECINSQEDMNVKITLLNALIISLVKEQNKDGNNLRFLNNKIENLKMLLEQLKKSLVVGDKNERKSK